MLTPQEVSSRSFPKAMMGGYNMAMVDEFLDELTDDYTALYKENAALKAKMKVLVEKVEDYRATEDSMRATLLTAQKMADSIVHEAEEKRDAMLAEANQAHETMVSQAEVLAQNKIGQMQQEIAETEARLQQGKEELLRFITAGQELCKKQLEKLRELPQLEVASPAAQEPVVSNPVEESVPAMAEAIEESVMASFQLPTEAAPAASTQTETVSAANPFPVRVEEEPAAPQAAPEQSMYTRANPFGEKEDLGATRRINLNDLQFGRNYTGEQ